MHFFRKPLIFKRKNFLVNSNFRRSFVIMQDNKDTIYGIYPILEALKAGEKPEKLLIKKGLSGYNVAEILKICKENDVVVQEVPVEKLDRTVRGNHQGIVAFLSPIELLKAEECIDAILRECNDPMILVLDRVTDVRNFGALCRTAECAGFKAVIVPAKGAARIGADAVKSSAGAMNLIKIARSSHLRNTLKYLGDKGFDVIACSEKTEDSLFDLKNSDKMALVLGSEENGIAPENLKFCTSRAKIPMFGKIGSLNVAAAGAIAMYEMVRVRNSK